VSDWWLFNIWAEKDLGTKMWLLGWVINPDYNSFRIKQVLKPYTNKPSIHAGLNPKFLNKDGSQMNTIERKEKYGNDWLN
jgi:hypothetical protein